MCHDNSSHNLVNDWNIDMDGKGWFFTIAMKLDELCCFSYSMDQLKAEELEEDAVMTMWEGPNHSPGKHKHQQIHLVRNKTTHNLPPECVLSPVFEERNKNRTTTWKDGGTEEDFIVTNNDCLSSPKAGIFTEWVEKMSAACAEQVHGGKNLSLRRKGANNVWEEAFAIGRERSNVWYERQQVHARCLLNSEPPSKHCSDSTITYPYFGEGFSYHP